MKHFLLACLFPALLTAQNMQLTEQLGKTVLYDDIALSSDGAHVACVQSTATTTSKQTHIRGTSGNAAAAPVNLATTGERQDSDPAWSPDSKGLAFFSNAGEKDQAQLWTVNADGSNPKKVTNLKGYAARPRWSHDGKRIAFLYIEGLMSDEGFHGGDLFTVSAAGHDVVNRTQGRKSSVSSLFWQTPDRILFTEYVGGGSAISELTLANTSAQTPTWGKDENLEWTNDGFNIQGWLLPPAKVESGKKYPMVVLIHGGPSSVTTPEWPAGFGMSRAIVAALSSRGYYVLLPNPRGSYGQGENF